MNTKLKAPFPYFGGKSKIAGRVWELLGVVQNYVEPFAGSCAVLLNRPTPVKGPETINDYSCHVVNAWRAIRYADTMALANALASPCSEVDTEAQHYELVNTEGCLRDMLGSPETYDLMKAAWWIKGANAWIGSGWAGGGGPWRWSRDSGWIKGDSGRGINRKLPHLGSSGTGINRQLPHLGDSGKGQYDQRVAFIAGWIYALRDRLCETRIACGCWTRVVGPSVTEKHPGITGIFMDPPYDGTEYVYSKGHRSVSAEVLEWCKTATSNKLRIVLAGRGSEHDELLHHGWSKESWIAGRGYSYNENNGRKEEALWVSPSIKTESLV